jgi:hypothetical protein
MPKSKRPGTNLTVSRPVELLIRVIRGQKVILDADLAALYQVETRTLNQAVRRNMDRFPDDFMLQLSADEAESLRSQIVISNMGSGGRRFLPYAFTELGVVMLSSGLKSRRAVADEHLHCAGVRPPAGNDRQQQRPDYTRRETGARP